MTAPPFGDPRISYQYNWMEGYSEFSEVPSVGSIVLDGKVVGEFDYSAYAAVNAEPSDRQIYDDWINSLKKSADA